MVMKNYKFIFIAFLIGVTILSVFRYVASLKEKYDLLNELQRSKEQVTVLENEKQTLTQELQKERQLQQKLSQEISKLKDNLKANYIRLTNLFGDFQDAENKIEQLESQSALLKAENTALREEKENLRVEKESLQAKLNSIAELKKAIKELKMKARRLKTEIKRKIKTEEFIEGNRGYLVKDGKSTYSPLKVRIEVMPLPVKE